MKIYRLIICYVLLIWFSLFNHALGQELKSTFLMRPSSDSLSEKLILNSYAETSCLIKQLYADTLKDEFFTNALVGELTIRSDFSTIMEYKKMVFTNEPAYGTIDNKISINIGSLTYMLEMEKPSDKIYLDENGKPIIGIGSKLRFDLEEWVFFFGKKYRNGSVQITNNGLIFLEGTEKLDDGTRSKYDGKNWISDMYIDEAIQSDSNNTFIGRIESIAMKVYGDIEMIKDPAFFGNPDEFVPLYLIDYPDKEFSIKLGDAVKYELVTQESIGLNDYRFSDILKCKGCKVKIVCYGKEMKIISLKILNRGE